MSRGASYAPALRAHAGSVSHCGLIQPDAQQRQQLVGVDRLGDVVARAGLEALLAVALHRLRGQRDHREVLPLGALADAAQRLVAVHLRHHDVHQDDVDVRVLLELGERALAVLGVDHVHLVALEQRRQREDVAQVVVDDEHVALRELRIALREPAQHALLALGQVRLDAVQEQRGLVEQPLHRRDVLDDHGLREAVQALLVLVRSARGPV